jgi:hypothetical protein
LSKIALEGNASGTGTFTLASPNSSTDRTLDLPDASGVIDRLNRAGNVLQVVTGTLATGTSTTSVSFVDVGLSASITPSSASSKVLVLVYPSVSNVDTDSNAITFQVLRDATSITKAVNHLHFTGFSFTRRAALMLSVLDSPSTTSATTYKLQFHSRLGNSVTTNAANDIATITLMEIAG